MKGAAPQKQSSVPARRPRARRRVARPRAAAWLGAAAAALAIGGLLSWDTLRVRRFDVPSSADFEAHLDASGERVAYERFCRFLAARGVGAVVPPWQLWRQGIEWRALGAAPFAAPPEAAWGQVVPTLVALRELVIPAVGAVDVVSGYRTADYNARAGGARESRHLAFDAVDLVPRGFATRLTLQPRLLSLWRRRGPAARLGLGLYGGTRFHIDTHRHRRW